MHSDDRDSDEKDSGVSEEYATALMGPAPGGPAPAPMPVSLPAPLDAMSAETVQAITHDYVHTNKSVNSIATDLGITTQEVRQAIKRYGIDKKKSEVIHQVQQEELAAYSKFLLDHRVTTAEQHLRVSNQITGLVEEVAKKAQGKSIEELEPLLKQLKGVSAMLKTLSEALAASTGVGARAVALSGLTAEQGGLALAGTAGKKPLVSLNFNVSPPAERPAAQVMDAEVTDAEVIDAGGSESNE